MEGGPFGTGPPCRLTGTLGPAGREVRPGGGGQGLGGGGGARGGGAGVTGETTTPYLRDVYDHLVQVIDTIEIYRDILSEMHSTHLTAVSNRMNEIMKVLTVIATIFMPLTFIAGVYGMNFKHMPELDWHYGYYAIWLVMIGIGVGMYFYFRRKKWM